MECPECNGRGWYAEKDRHDMQVQVQCENCEGRGNIMEEIKLCPFCQKEPSFNGLGHVYHEPSNCMLGNSTWFIGDWNTRVDSEERNVIMAMSKYIVQQYKGGIVDHACCECIPGGDLVTKGFVCAYHMAKNIYQADAKGDT